MAIKKCLRCNDRKSYCKKMCSRCYYATKRGYKTYPEMAKERNFRRGKDGVLSDGRGHEWIVDAKDFEKLKEQIWYHSHSGYAKTTNGKYLHRLLCPQWKCIDHIDRNPFNNRKSNLRNGSGHINILNRVNRSASGFKAVHRMRKRWQAKVMGTYLGTFDTPEEAHRNVLKWAKDHGLEEFYKI